MVVVLCVGRGRGLAERKKTEHELFSLVTVAPTSGCSAEKIKPWTRPTSTDLQLNMEIRPGSEGPQTVWGECVQKTAGR